MNILFICYNDFRSNSALHINSFANQLARNGNNCIVAVPRNKNTLYKTIGGEILYNPLNYSELNGLRSIFKDGRGPDIIHAWTPREIVRRQCIHLLRHFDSKLIVHMEDNEEQIVFDYFKRPSEELYALTELEISRMTPLHLSHLFFYREFLEKADGVTIIIDGLSEFVPARKKMMVLWPGLDTSFFYSNINDGGLKSKLNISNDKIIICYTGNVHNSNYREVRSLYLAVAILNREGYPTVLIRTGDDYYDFLGEQTLWAHQYSIELGFVPYEMVPRILSIADVLVQPGRSDKFNNYRLPSKVPEFFYMQKPIILPKTNIGLHVRNGIDALLLDDGRAIDIFEKIKLIVDNTTLSKTLSNNASKFAAKYFSIINNTQQLEQFYLGVLNSVS